MDATTPASSGWARPAPGASSRPPSRSSQKFAPYLVGQDPLRIEHHWQYLYRSTHFRGAAIMGALSAIDIALWDIAGKHFGVPVYAAAGRQDARQGARLLPRPRPRRSTSWSRAASTPRRAASRPSATCRRSPTSRARQPYFKTHAAKMGEAIDAVRQFREAVGDDVDLCIEIHRRLTPAEAIVLARGIEPYHPLFYEDPILPDNFDAMALVAENIHIPIATGERLHTIFEFEMLLRRGAVQFVRPDVCMCGGITGAKKVAALAEAQLRRRRAAQPARPGQHRRVRAARRVHPELRDAGVSDRRGRAAEERDGARRRCSYDGHGSLIVPDAPGIGVELAPDAAERHPYKMRWLGTRLHDDGSVMDQ